MISKVTESNKNLIEARLAEINQALEAAGSSTRISSLESYYANIIEISQLTTKFHDAPYKFFLMPLDEPVFEIDANKRTITVPTDFNKNGVGVTGDHKAEVLYFKIDKYYDYQDLFNVDEIIINWQFRPANASRNTEMPINTSIALAPDDTYLPGYIVFGWVITNDMTPSKGTLSFSVGFVKGNKNLAGEYIEYNYVLNTQIANVTINDSLALEDPTVLSQLKRPVFERLSNSRFDADNVVPLVDPVFRSGEEDMDEFDNPVKMGLPAVANFALDDQTGVEDNELTLSVLGYAADDGIIKYRWHSNAYGEDPVDSDDSNTTDADFVLTEDTVPAEGIPYYVKKDGNWVQLTENSDPSLEDAFADDSIYQDAIFELGSSLTIEKAGIYSVTMQSEKEIVQPDESLPIVIRSGAVESQACVVPKAAFPKVNLQAESAVGPEGANGVPGYKIYDNNIANQYVFIANASPAITAEISIDDSEDKLANEGVTPSSSLGAIALKLVRNQENEADDAHKPVASEFENMTFNPLPANNKFSIEDENANVAGTYKVYAVNRRNHSYQVSDASNTIDISTIAPILNNISVFCKTSSGYNLKMVENNAFPNDSIGSIDLTTQNDTREFKIVVGDSGLSEDMEIYMSVIEVPTKWNDDQTPSSSVNVDEDGKAIPRGEEDGDIISINSDTPIDVLSDDGFEFEIDDPGWYVVQAIVHYHGTERITVTAPFTVVDNR